MPRKVLLTMDNKEALNTLKNIREMMEKSSRFLMLSGTSAILIGIYACIAATLAATMIYGDHGILATDFRLLPALVGLAILLIVLSLATAAMMSARKAKRMNQRLVFDRTARRFLWNFFLPLVAGGILCLSCLLQGQFGQLSAFMLILYGIALINSSAYTYSTSRYLGYAELLLGLADCFVSAHPLLFWTIGFGLFHILYGIFFQLKYGKQK